MSPMDVPPEQIYRFVHIFTSSTAEEQSRMKNELRAACVVHAAAQGDMSIDVLEAATQHKIDAMTALVMAAEEVEFQHKLLDEVKLELQFLVIMKSALVHPADELANQLAQLAL